MKILFINIYYNSQISENIIHISVINQLCNTDLIKTIQKEGGGQMILCLPHFKKLGPPSSPLATPMVRPSV